MSEENENYSLTYFNYRGKAEPIRLIFAVAGVDYVDNRLCVDSLHYFWGKLPILQVGEHTLAESSAICRFLAKRFGLTGNGEIEAAKCDEYVDAMMDLRARKHNPPKIKRTLYNAEFVDWQLYYTENEPMRKEQLKEKFSQVHLPYYLPRFVSILENSPGEFLLGENYTWADLHIAHTLTHFETCFDPNVLQGYPVLEEFKKSVFKIPQVQKWVEKRPETSR